MEGRSWVGRAAKWPFGENGKGRESERGYPHAGWRGVSLHIRRVINAPRVRRGGEWGASRRVGAFLSDPEVKGGRSPSRRGRRRGGPCTYAGFKIGVDDMGRSHFSSGSAAWAC